MLTSCVCERAKDIIQGAHELVSTPTGQKFFVKPMTVFLDTLNFVAKHDGKKESNAGLLYTLLDKIWASDDKFDPDCKNIHMIGEMTRLLIKSRLKVSPESIAYPGEVRLPTIYTAKSTPFSTPTKQRGKENNKNLTPIPLSSIKKTGRTSSPWISCLPPGFTLADEKVVSGRKRKLAR